MQQGLVSLEKITKAFGDKTILENVHFQINVNDRVGIVGLNGAGKSTLLDIITGRATCELGTVRWLKRGCTVHYLTQSRSEIMRSLSLDDAYVQTKRLRLSQDVVRGDTTRRESASGGEKTKMALASAFGSRADMLILDEPTNHLDADGISWLIGEVNSYKGTVVMVSHDRYFLDKTVSKIAELHDGRLKLYAGNYSLYEEARERERQALARAYEQQQREQERLEEKIEQVKHWAEQSHQQAGKQGTLAERRQMGYKQFHRAKAKKLDQRAKSHIKRLEKLRTTGIAKPSELPSAKLNMGQATRHGRALLEARRIRKRFGERDLFTDSSFFILRGDRIGLYGANGCGKTTLLKMIMGEECVTDGELWRSSSAKIGYLSQDEMLPSDDIMHEFESEMSTHQRNQFRTALADMGLDYRRLKIRGANLSYGERMRFRLAWLGVQDYNLLILDEPTNHLDITSRQELERAMLSYEGTLLIATHDRYLMERLCTNLLVFSDGRVSRRELTLKEEGAGAPFDMFAAPPKVREDEEELLIVETKISQLLGDLSCVTPKQKEYERINSELDLLLQRKKAISARQSR